MSKSIVIIDLHLTNFVEEAYKECVKYNANFNYESLVNNTNKPQKKNLVEIRAKVLDILCKAIIESGENGIIMSKLFENSKDCEFATEGSLYNSIVKKFKTNYVKWKVVKKQKTVFAYTI